MGCTGKVVGNAPASAARRRALTRRRSGNMLRSDSGALNMEVTTLRITGMKDEQCLRLVTNAIQDLPGIGHVELSLETGEASIEHGRFVSAADIHQAIEDAGFGIA